MGPPACAAALQGLFWVPVLGTPGSRAYPRPSLARAPHPSGLALILTSVRSLSTPFISPQPGPQLAITDNCSSLV